MFRNQFVRKMFYFALCLGGRCVLCQLVKTFSTQLVSAGTTHPPNPNSLVKFRMVFRTSFNNLNNITALIITFRNYFSQHTDVRLSRVTRPASDLDVLDTEDEPGNVTTA